MQGKVTAEEKILRLARKHGMLRSRELQKYGIARESLRRLSQRGLLVQSGRGIYLPAEAQISEHHSLAVTSKLIPQSVVCLLSALRFHDLTTQEPHEVWLALSLRAHQPSLKYPPLQTVRMNATTHNVGIEEHVIENVQVRIFNVAKTIADCFKYRRLVGIDVALEATSEAWRERRFTMDELWYYARLCRVANVMRPYIDAMVVS